MAVGLTDLLAPVPRPLLHVTVPEQPAAVNVALCPLAMLDALADRTGAAGGTQAVDTVTITLPAGLTQPSTAQVAV